MTLDAWLAERRERLRPGQPLAVFAPSPLNWFTMRRRMETRLRDPDRAKAGERLWNGAGIGLVDLDEQGR